MSDRTRKRISLSVFSYNIYISPRRTSGWLKTRHNTYYFRWDNSLFYSELNGYRRYVKWGKLILGYMKTLPPETPSITKP